MTSSKGLPECLGAVFNCDDPTPNCRNSAHFDFRTMWNITNQYWEQCHNGTWLFKQPGVLGDVPQDEASLTNTVCELIAGDTSTSYPSADVWYRLTTWKFPLFQLITISPRPPIGFWEEAFSIIHLLGDPIGSYTDLVRKIDSCQSRAEFWKHKLNEDKLRPILQAHGGPYELGRQRLWKALALIVISYDEWGSQKGDACQVYLKDELTALSSETVLEKDRKLFITQCLECASQLAADRSTKFLPVIVAQAFFIGSVAIAIIRTKSLAKGLNPQTYIDIETYSIGFTALYFWAISTITLTSIIGTSQTANSIPDILRGFHWKLCKAFPKRQIQLSKVFDDEDRYWRGGIYSWQPDGAFKDVFSNAVTSIQRRLTPMRPPNRRRLSIESRLYQSWPWIVTVLPLLSVSFGTVIGMTITSLVPPDGWSCRSDAEIAIFFIWLVSYPCTLIPWGHYYYRPRFWFTFAKDSAAVAATMGLIMATQIGIFNKCSCYTRNGKIGLALPQTPVVKAILEHRLELHYPILTAIGIFAQLVVFPGIILLWYSEAARVFLQRDDGKSNLQWYHSISSWWMKNRKGDNGYDPTEGVELGNITYADEAISTSSGCGPDETNKTKGTTLQVKEIVLENKPMASLPLQKEAFSPFQITSERSR